MPSISDAYSTTALYKTAFSLTANTQDTRIDSVLIAVSRYIDRRCGRFFGIDAAVVERIYSPSGRRLSLDGRPAFMVNDIATKTGLVIKQDDDLDGSFADETAWTIETDFLVWPEQADKGPEAEPWRAIVIPTWSAKSFLAEARLSVTAKFGWAAVPTAIAQGTLEIAGIVMTDSPRATSRIQEGVDAAIAASPEAQSIVLALVDTYGHGLAFS